MTSTYFVAGTDTGVGKSLVSAALLHKAAEAGHASLGLKPVAAGCELSEDGYVNQDALLLQKYSSVKLSYQQHNPVALPEAIAPHIAAVNAGKKLQAGRIAGYCRGAITREVGLCLVEGAGGWRVPLNRQQTMATLAAELAAPVILVVGVRLGCINHALLTAEAIHRDGLRLAGWVANQIEPEMPALEENIGTLAALLPVPCLGQVPFLEAPTPELFINHLDIKELLN